MRLLVIENPAAGRGNGRAVARLVSAFEARGHVVTSRPTEKPGDAARHAAAAEGDVDCIVAAGGDGTLNEVLNGLADPSTTRLAPFGLGTANMLARALRVPRDPERLAALIERGTTRRLDLCRAGTRRFLCVAGVGFDAAVTERVRLGRSGPLGYRGYLAPVLETLLRDREPQLEVRLDGGPAQPCAFVIASKLDNYGGLFSVTPEAQPDSGMIEVCLFDRARARDLIRHAVAALWTRVSGRTGFRIERARRVEITASSPTPVQLDGDPAGHTPVSIDLVPAQVPICAPAPRSPRGERSRSARR